MNKRALHQAVTLLSNRLSWGSPVSARLIEAECAARGITPGTLRRARKMLGVEVMRQGRSRTWRLEPPTEPCRVDVVVPFERFARERIAKSTRELAALLPSLDPDYDWEARTRARLKG